MLIAILSLIAGFLSVLAPCVLPLLPIIIGGSFTGAENKKRPYIIIASLVFSLILFTILLKISTSLIGIDPRVWEYISGGIVVALGLTLLFPKLWDEIIGRLGLQAKSQQLLGSAGRQKNGTISAVFTGLALGPVFSSCSPMYAWVIATVLPESTSRGLVYLGMYSIGLAAALLGISVLGRRMIDKIKWLSDPHGAFQKTIAVLFIAVGLAVATGFYKDVQTYLVDKDFLNIKSLEEKLIPSDDESSQLKENQNMNDAEYFNVEPYDAPELVGLQDWINSEPQTLASLRGKVVLIDFWTYSCINCIRTLPFVQGWHDAYADDGLVILGLHAPEFAFEKVPENVRKAVIDRNVTYPVALDNDFATWNVYENRFWPAHYLIDKNGQVRRTHFGEGEYKETEQAIQDLLDEAGASDLGALTANDIRKPFAKGQTPETYIGSSRAERVTNEQLIKGAADYTLSPDQPLNTWSLGGRWDVQADYSKCIRDCELQFHYTAKEVYAVFSGDSKGIVTINGAQIQITSDDLYTLVKNDESREEIIKIGLSEGLSIHAFTFGS